MKRDANQNNEVPPHTCQNGYHQQINKQVLEKMWRKRKFHALPVRMQTGAVTVENTIEFPQMIKNQTSIQLSNPTSRNISQENRNTNQKGYMNPYAHSSIIAKIWK